MNKCKRCREQGIETEGKLYSCNLDGNLVFGRRCFLRLCEKCILEIKAQYPNLMYKIINENKDGKKYDMH